MSKKDQYGLEFLKVTAGGDIGYNCIRKDGIVDGNNLLQFLNYLIHLVQSCLSKK